MLYKLIVAVCLLATPILAQVGVVDPSVLKQAGATTGQGLVWDGTKWAPDDVSTGAHDLVGADHTASGLTTGHVLQATGATTFGFAALTNSQIPTTLTDKTLVGPVTAAYNIASFPSVNEGGEVYAADGLTARDCTVGGGSNVVRCRWNGVSWNATGGETSPLYTTSIDTFAELDSIVADQTLVHSGSNIATATALAADPADCPAGSLAAGINASGVAQGCADPILETELDTISELQIQIADATLLTTADEGTGNGLDADTVDGVEAAAFLLLTGGTLSGQLVASNLGVEFTESDTNPTCASGNYSVYADLSENKLKACQNGTASDLLGGGATALNDLTDVTAPSPSEHDVLSRGPSGWINGNILTRVAAAGLSGGCIPYESGGSVGCSSVLTYNGTMLRSTTHSQFDALVEIGRNAGNVRLDGFNGGAALTWRLHGNPSQGALISNNVVTLGNSTAATLQLGSSAASCSTASGTGVVTCTDPTPGSGVAAWRFRAGAGQSGTSNKILEVLNASGTRVWSVSAVGSVRAENTIEAAIGIRIGNSNWSLRAASVGGNAITATTDWQAGATAQYRLTDGDYLTGTPVAGFGLAAAGVAKITDGLTGYGKLDASGIRISGSAPSGNVLRGNGTDFVAAQLNYSDMAGTVPDADITSSSVLQHLTQAISFSQPAGGDPVHYQFFVTTTVTAASCRTDAGTATLTIYESTAPFSGTDSTVSTINCTDSGVAGTISDATIAANSYVRFVYTSESGVGAISTSLRFTQ